MEQPEMKALLFPAARGVAGRRAVMRLELRELEKSFGAARRAQRGELVGVGGRGARGAGRERRPVRAR